MIESFADPATQALFHGSPKKACKNLPPDIQATAVRKLDMLNAAHALGDLRSPPGNRLEALLGTLAGFHSIRVNDKWRILFRWEGANAYDVQISDYH